MHGPGPRGARGVGTRLPSAGLLPCTCRSPTRGSFEHEYMYMYTCIPLGAGQWPHWQLASCGRGSLGADDSEQRRSSRGGQGGEPESLRALLMVAQIQVGHPPTGSQTRRQPRTCACCMPDLCRKQNEASRRVPTSEPRPHRAGALPLPLSPPVAAVTASSSSSVPQPQQQLLHQPRLGGHVARLARRGRRARAHAVRDGRLHGAPKLLDLREERGGW